MEAILGKSWRTTCIGLTLTIIQGIIAATTAGISLTPQLVIQIIAPAVLGAFAKDSNVTGKS